MISAANLIESIESVEVEIAAMLADLDTIEDGTPAGQFYSLIATIIDAYEMRQTMVSAYYVLAAKFGHPV